MLEQILTSHVLVGAIEPATLLEVVDAIPLQSGGTLGGWETGDFFEAAMNRLGEVASVVAFAAIVAIPLYLALYLWSKRHTVPIVTLTLMGSAVMPILPSSAARIGYILILLAGGVALFGLLWAVIR